MKIKLESHRRCPFVHPNPDDLYDIVIKGREKNGFYVLCEYCGARGPTALSVHEAIEDWEKRSKL